eukprot:scpid88062/ scgid12209/ 
MDGWLFLVLVATSLMSTALVACAADSVKVIEHNSGKWFDMDRGRRLEGWPDRALSRALRHVVIAPKMKVHDNGYIAVEMTLHKTGGDGIPSDALQDLSVGAFFLWEFPGVPKRKLECVDVGPPPYPGCLEQFAQNGTTKCRLSHRGVQAPAGASVVTVNVSAVFKPNGCGYSLKEELKRCEQRGCAVHSICPRTVLNLPGAPEIEFKDSKKTGIGQAMKLLRFRVIGLYGRSVRSKPDYRGRPPHSRIAFIRHKGLAPTISCFGGLPCCELLGSTPARANTENVYARIRCGRKNQDDYPYSFNLTAQNVYGKQVAIVWVDRDGGVHMRVTR